MSVERPETPPGHTRTPVRGLDRAKGPRTPLHRRASEWWERRPSPARSVLLVAAAAALAAGFVEAGDLALTLLAATIATAAYVDAMASAGTSGEAARSRGQQLDRLDRASGHAFVVLLFMLPAFYAGALLRMTILPPAPGG